ncbi:FIG00484733: hypothetical protein [Alloactinosynnema sp. L-07]|nr:FIG00484733: hypothetical protein [Alloactinosynnema sp. L-07]
MKTTPLLVCALTVAVQSLLPSIAQAVPQDPGAAVDQVPPAVPVTAPDEIPIAQRAKVLGKDWQRSTDRAVVTSGDSQGLHVLVSEANTGYKWRTVTTLAEDGVTTDLWIGNSCVTGDGRKAVVTYAPRTATNDEKLFQRGGLVATVDLVSGAVTKLPLTSTLAYYSPSCGAGNEALVTQAGGTTKAATRIYRVDAAKGSVAKPITVAGQLTSAVPTKSGIVGADDGRLVRIDDGGKATTLAAAAGVPFRLAADADGGVVFMDRDGETASVRRVDATSRGRAKSTLLGSGKLDRVNVTSGSGGRVFLTGEVSGSTPLPASVQRIAAPKDAVVSTLGTSVITSVRTAPSEDPTVFTKPISVEMSVRSTNQRATFTVEPSVANGSGAGAAHPALDVSTKTAIASGGSPSDPVEAERYCSVPVNDIKNQALQPKPRQVEWAVDQAITNSLNVQRPADWKNLGMPAYTPQGLFPGRALLGGGRVPAQVFLGIIAQESNMWMAPAETIAGVGGNPLVGNYWGRNLKPDGDPNNDWAIDFTDADCGYGVTQITDHMRMAGREKGPNDTAWPYETQRAVALDFATNVAAGLQVLQDKWNQTKGAGMAVNNGDPAKIENWFYAVWAYNSGFYPQSAAAVNSGAWGLGWLNNPANPHYPANRSPFLETSYADAAHPGDWPYPEKVMGWAGHPIEGLEGPGRPVSGFRAAWWNGDAQTSVQNRAAVKPPITQFCDSSNSCQPGGTFDPDAPEVDDEPLGPCHHLNESAQIDLKCWYHQSSTWKSNCSYSCGNELLRFDPGYAYQEDGFSYPPNCQLTGLPSGALIVDDMPNSGKTIRPNCTRNFNNEGTFSLDFGADAAGNYPSKVDFHQISAGFYGHFYFAHTRVAAVRGNSMRVSGTWTLNRTLNQWGRVLVHLPSHGAHTQQAQYEIDLGNGVKKTRVVNQRVMADKWISLGVFQFAGTPKVRLSSVTYDGDDGVKPIEGEDIAFDAVAFQPLAAKPRNIVVAMGDSYASGEGASNQAGVDYYAETDNNGNVPTARNSCHRSWRAWSRSGVLADNTASTIGQRADLWDANVDYHMVACSGARTENLLPYYTAPPAKPTNAFGKQGTTAWGELSQMDQGYLDENTTLVTLSVGGNDARFVDVLNQCVIYAGLSLCQDTVLDGTNRPAGEEVPALVAGPVADSVVIALREIHLRAPNAKVILMGYPRLLEGNGQCIPGIGTGEAPWINDMGDLLNQHLMLAVNRANIDASTPYVTFGDPRSAFAGKGVCGDPESIHGIIAPWNRTGGEETLPLPSQQSMHPKIEGAQLFANVYTSTLRAMGL